MKDAVAELKEVREHLRRIHLELAANREMSSDALDVIRTKAVSGILCGVDIEFEHGVSWSAGKTGYLRSGESVTFEIRQHQGEAIFGVRAHAWGGAVITDLRIATRMLVNGRCTVFNNPRIAWMPGEELQITLMIPGVDEGLEAFGK